MDIYFCILCFTYLHRNSDQMNNWIAVSNCIHLIPIQRQLEVEHQIYHENQLIPLSGTARH